MLQKQTAPITRLPITTPGPHGPPMLHTFHLSHVQGLAQLLQEVSAGGVLLVLLAVVVLLGHARVVEPRVA